MTDQLAFVMSLGLATFGLAAFIRALPWPQKWVAVKPLGCPVCMSGWSAFAVMGLAYWLGVLSWSPPAFALIWCACVGVSAPLFKHLYPPEVDLPLP